jgi:hypothetical protein
MALAFLIDMSDGVIAPVLYLLKEGRTVAGSGEAIDVSYSGYPSIAWAEGDSRLVLMLPKDRSLKILDRGFAEVKSLPIPDGVPDIYRVRAAGRILLFQAYGPESVWRLDLDTEKWKRVWRP